MAPKRSNAHRSISRRTLLVRAAAATAALGASPLVKAKGGAGEKPSAPKNRIKQSVCKWCYGKEPLDTFAAYCAQIGMKSIELLGKRDWGPRAATRASGAMLRGKPPRGEVGTCVSPFQPTQTALALPEATS